jgi:hypothetical protein
VCFSDCAAAVQAAILTPRKPNLDTFLAVASRRDKITARVLICPLKTRQPHGPKRPGLLTDEAIRRIERQIRAKDHRPLPILFGNQFYRCGDCYAVWYAASAFERVSKERVCGFYDQTLVWKPVSGTPE